MSLLRYTKLINFNCVEECYICEESVTSGRWISPQILMLPPKWYKITICDSDECLKNIEIYFDIKDIIDNL